MIPIHRQAHAYADWMQKNNRTDVAFFPDKRTSSATPNTAKRFLLSRLLSHPADDNSIKSSAYTRILVSAANASGYTLSKVSYTDYDPLYYKDDIEETILDW